MYHGTTGFRLEPWGCAARNHYYLAGHGWARCGSGGHRQHYLVGSHRYSPDHTDAPRFEGRLSTRWARARRGTYRLGAAISREEEQQLRPTRPNLQANQRMCWAIWPGNAECLHQSLGEWQPIS